VNGEKEKKYCGFMMCVEGGAQQQPRGKLLPSLKLF
jgi:hypothetical protein